MSNPNIPTPHITAKEGDFARTVLMPGDPLRSKFIAETYLENPVLVNDTRGVQGYTGLYHGKRVSVMASGMGIPSIGIYSYELFNFYGVENIIRVGTAGGLSDSVNVRDVVIGLSSYTNSNFGRQFGFDGNVAPCCSFKLLEQAVAAARRMGIEPTVGPLYSSDIFYDESGMSGKLKKLGVLAAEGLVIRLAQLGFRPVGDAAGAFNIGGKKNPVQHSASSFHAMSSAISIIWVKEDWRACASSDSFLLR